MFLSYLLCTFSFDFPNSKHLTMSSTLLLFNSCSVSHCLLNISSWILNTHLKSDNLKSELFDPQFYPSSPILLFYFGERLLLPSSF